jgi:hypothetical protein
LTYRYPASRIPDETIASMVCLTVCSLSGIPEFQEFQPIGAVRRTGAPEPTGAVPPHPTATAQTRLKDTTTDMNRAPTGRGLPIEMGGRCALSAVMLAIEYA